MSKQKDSVYDKWRDAYLIELDLWSANETPMRESLFGAGMRHADKRIAELEAVIAEFIYVESKGGAEYEHITREAMEASLKTKESEGCADD